jgi:hypothetical protein
MLMSAMSLLAVRPIDLAIFATMGALWVGGAVFIVLVYRWILRYERENDPPDAVHPRSTPTPVRVQASVPVKDVHSLAPSLETRPSEPALV